MFLLPFCYFFGGFVGLFFPSSFVLFSCILMTIFSTVLRLLFGCICSYHRFLACSYYEILIYQCVCVRAHVCVCVHRCVCLLDTHAHDWFTLLFIQFQMALKYPAVISSFPHECQLWYYICVWMISYLYYLCLYRWTFSNFNFVSSCGLFFFPPGEAPLLFSIKLV